MIRLSEADFLKWRQTFHAIADLRAELVTLDAWFSSAHPPGDPKRKDWFFAVSGALNKKHQRLTTERAAGGPANTGSFLEEIDRMYRSMGVL